MKVLVTMGYYDAGGDGALWGVDLASGRADLLLRYEPPPALRVPTRGFTGGSWGPDGALYVVGHAAVYRIDPRAWRVDGVLHLPSFNDLHHVAAVDERLYVANTGSDAIDVFARDGRFLGAHHLAPGWLLARRMSGSAPGRDVDVAASTWNGAPPPGWTGDFEDDGYHTPDSERGSTPYWRSKLPDRLHPNHVCVAHGAVLVTCLNDGSIRDVSALSVISRTRGLFPHDGLARDDGFWFTSIDGGLWRLPGLRGPTPAERALDVFALADRWGWCRGLWMDDESAVIGLTEVRRGRLPAHRWSDRPPEGSETSVLWIDRECATLRGRVDLSDRARHSKIYSILPWDGQ
ncbi:MAG: hypothetical protein H6711_30180 [Myxococcales bacterium]|nr:hypothetical protein [Myxococcales bacterium]